MARPGAGIVAERFAENLRKVRRRAGLSQEQLAKRASLHRTEVGMLEGAARTCRIDTLVQLAGAMAVPPGELLDGIDWVPGPDTEGTFTQSSRPISHQVRSERSDPGVEQSKTSYPEA